MNIQALSETGSTLKRVIIRRKLMAFLISFGAIFSALVVGWSWTINGYQTNCEIAIQANQQAFDKQQFQVLVANTIRTKVTDPVLADLLTRTKAAVPVQSRILMGDRGDLESLRKAIHVKISSDSVPLKLRFSLNGVGTADEQLFLQSFTADFANELIRLSRVSAGSSEFVVQNAEFARYRQVVDDLEGSVQQLERRINEVQTLCGTSEPSSTPFRTASHRKSNFELSHEDLKQLHQKVSNIDLDFLRESTVELKSLLDSIATSGQPYTLPQVHPVGTPQPKQLFVLAILAAAFGLVVSNHYLPLANRGFSNIAEVSSKLGIPVVATVPINQGRGLGAVSESANDRKLPWANRLIRYATGWLLAFGVLVIGFCLINAEIREIFYQNPVDGLARMFWYFKS